MVSLVVLVVGGGVLAHVCTVLLPNLVLLMSDWLWTSTNDVEGGPGSCSTTLQRRKGTLDC